MRETLDVKIKKLVPEAVIPYYATPDSAGMDMTAVSYHYDREKKCHIYDTGIAMELPKGYAAFLLPRSSNNRTDCYVTNSVGLLDSDYRGTIKMSYKDRDALSGDTIPELIKPYEVGDRICQILILPYPMIKFTEVEELSKTERGEGGHGSTGR